MQNMNFSERIKILAKQVENLAVTLETVADIGTDHGYLPMILFNKNLVKRGILCDINQGPLDNAKQTFLSTPYNHNVEFRLGSGIEPLSIAESDLVIIAGMGGALIKDILSKDLTKTKSMKYYLLQPMTEQEMLRKWLLSNGFVYLWDQFAEVQGKHYEMILVTTLTDVEFQNHQCLDVSSNDLEFGLKILDTQTDAALNFLAHKRLKYQTILDNLSNALQETNSSKHTLCLKKIETLDRIVSELKGR